MADALREIFCGGGSEKVCGVVGFNPDFLVGCKDRGGKKIR